MLGRFCSEVRDSKNISVTPMYYIITSIHASTHTDGNHTHIPKSIKDIYFTQQSTTQKPRMTQEVLFDTRSKGLNLNTLTNHLEAGADLLIGKVGH